MYVGEWVVAVVAETRTLAEDAAELIEIDYEALPFVVDAEEALDPTAPPVHAAHGSNVLYHRTFTWGPVAEDFASQPNQLSFDLRWGRSAPIPVETFGVVAEWDAGAEILEVWASIQMPSYGEQISGALGIPFNQVRAHYDVDVGGSYGVKRGIKHTVLAGFLARKLGRAVRLVEDRLENMVGGDMHGPDREFRVAVAFDDQGLVRSMKLRVREDVGGHTGRAPFQLGKPVSAIVGAYQINSVEYEAIAVSTNKTGQTAVRGVGMSPTNVAIETAIDKVARQLGLSRLVVRQRNFIRADQFPYLIPSGSEYDSGDYHTVLGKAWDLAQLDRLLERRDAARRVGKIAGIGFATCLEPGGGNSAFEPLLNREERDHHLAGILCHQGGPDRWHHRHHRHLDLGTGARDAGRYHYRGGTRHRPEPDPSAAFRHPKRDARQHAGGQPDGDHAGRCGDRRGGDNPQ